MSEELDAEVNAGTEIAGETGSASLQAEPTTEVTTDPYVEKALAQGWRPKEEWHGDPEAWRPAREFVERGELLGSISELRRDNREMREALQFLTEHHKKVKETEFNRALSVLKAEKKKALEEGDADRLLQVDDAIDLVKKQQAEQAEQVKTEQKKPNGPTEAFLSWNRQNSWYKQDDELTQYADTVGLGYFQRNPNAAEMDVYNYVEKMVKKAFPEKFKGAAPKTPQVEGNTNTRPSSSKTPSLNEEQTRAMNSFVRMGVMTKEEYIKELQRTGAI